MGIVRNDKETTAIHRFGKDVSEVWKNIDGAWRMVWQLIRSCFGAGYWVNEKPWFNDEGWNNNNV